MKKLLLLALSVVAIVGCQKDPMNPPTTPDTPGDEASIILRTPSASLSRAGNSGIREVFEADDEIGVFAAYIGKTPIGPDWAKLYITNKPAVWSKAGEPATSPNYSYFNWGAKGSTPSLATNQFYPKKDARIALYAYYPYTASADSAFIDVTGNIPVRKIALKSGKVVGATTTDVNLTEMDYMWAVGKSIEDPALDSINRSSPLDTLTFKHALSQIEFGIYRSDKKVSECRFVSVKFFVPKNGQMSLIDGAVTPATGTSVAADSAEYEITIKTGTPIPYAKVGDESADTLRLLDLKPIMVMPMTDVMAKGCRLEVTLEYGDEGSGDVKTFTIDMAGMKAIKQGNKNTLYLSVGQTQIDLIAKIAPWGENTEEENPSLDVE